ncbi:hypothetical protein GCK32_021984, partial [Trichostrongylus colubriformis]
MVLDEELMNVNAHASRSMDENGASPTVGGSEEAPPQTNRRDVRDVLGEIQQTRQRLASEEKQMEIDLE